MKVGYARVSTVEQNEARQLKMFEEQEVEKYFLDKASGKNADRPALKEMLSFIREGDIVVVESISRLARNTVDLLKIVEQIENKHAIFVSLKESIDTNSPQGKFMLTVFGACAELERECIRQRQAEGIALAKQEGKYKGKPKMEINENALRKECQRWRAGEITATTAMKNVGLKPNTFYRRVKELNL